MKLTCKKHKPNLQPHTCLTCAIAAHSKAVCGPGDDGEPVITIMLPARFFDGNEAALADMKRLAEEEAANASAV